MLKIQVSLVSNLKRVTHVIPIKILPAFGIDTLKRFLFLQLLIHEDPFSRKVAPQQIIVDTLKFPAAQPIIKAPKSMWLQTFAFFKSLSVYSICVMHLLSVFL